jgi:hypothetical protein
MAVIQRSIVNRARRLFQVFFLNAAALNTLKMGLIVPSMCMVVAATLTTGCSQSGSPQERPESSYSGPNTSTTSQEGLVLVQWGGRIDYSGTVEAISIADRTITLAAGSDRIDIFIRADATAPKKGVSPDPLFDFNLATTGRKIIVTTAPAGQPLRQEGYTVYLVQADYIPPPSVVPLNPALVLVQWGARTDYEGTVEAFSATNRTVTLASGSEKAEVYIRDSAMAPQYNINPKRPFDFSLLTIGQKIIVTTWLFPTSNKQEGSTVWLDPQRYIPPTPLPAPPLTSLVLLTSGFRIVYEGIVEAISVSDRTITLAAGVEKTEIYIHDPAVAPQGGVNPNRPFDFSLVAVGQRIIISTSLGPTKKQEGFVIWLVRADYIAVNGDPSRSPSSTPTSPPTQITPAPESDNFTLVLVESGNRTDYKGVIEAISADNRTITLASGAERITIRVRDSAVAPQYGVNPNRPFDFGLVAIGQKVIISTFKSPTSNIAEGLIIWIDLPHYIPPK